MEPSTDDQGPVPLMPKPGATSLPPPPSRSILTAAHQLVPPPLTSTSPLVSPRAPEPTFTPPLQKLEAPVPPTTARLAYVPPHLSRPVIPAQPLPSKPVLVPPPTPKPVLVIPPTAPSLRRSIVPTAVVGSKLGRSVMPKQRARAGTLFTITLITLGFIITVLYVWGAQVDRSRSLEPASSIE